VGDQAIGRPLPGGASAPGEDAWNQRLEPEGTPEEATLGEALYWTQIYAEILVMEEAVLDRIRKLALTESTDERYDVELTNVNLVVAQADRFRRRHGSWTDRVTELRNAVQVKAKR
jgi:hypothetical protein